MTTIDPRKASCPRARARRHIRNLSVDLQGAGTRTSRFIAAAACIFLIAACNGKEAGQGAGGGSGKGAAPGAAAVRKIPVEVRPVEVRDVTYSIKTVGSLHAAEVVRVPARVAGVVEKIFFEEGSSVDPGKTLARVDTERYRLAAQRGEANYRQAEARAREIEAGLEKRKALREKDPGWVTEEELNNFSAQLDQAQAATGAAKAAFDLARRDVAESEVRASVPGVINEKLVETGQYVSAGTPIATIVDTRRIKLAFKVAESESGRLSEGSPIEFTVQAVPARTFRASIYHIGKVADPATRMVECLAWVDSPGLVLRPGFFADVTIDVEERKGSIVVPQTAAIPTDQGFIGFVMKGEDRVEQRSLRLGLHAPDGSVEVLEGFSAGEQVVVKGANVLSPDSRVDAQPPGGGATR